MKSLRQLCAASILVMVLVFSAFAGEMSTPGITSPPPDQSSVEGNMDTPGITSDQSSLTGEISTPGITAVALFLLGGMM